MDQLALIAKQLGGRIKPIQLLNPNAGTANKWVSVKAYRGRKIAIEEYSDLFGLKVAVESTLHCAVNRPDMILNYRKQLDVPGVRGAVYFRNDSILIEHASFWRMLGALLDAANLQPKEALHFTGNGVCFYVGKYRDLLVTLDGLLDLLESNAAMFFGASGGPISTAGVPEVLRVLLPLLDKLAVSDDLERGELNLSAADKKYVLDKVRPLFKEISAYLDSFGKEPMSEAAMLIGALAELASELDIEDRERKNS